jgi:tetratricopeptide (TPR) repeat protein
VKNTKLFETMQNAKKYFDNAQYSQAIALAKKANKLASYKTFESIEIEIHSLIKMKKENKALTICSELIELSSNDAQLLIAHRTIGEIEVINMNFQAAVISLEHCIKLDSSINNANSILMLCKLYQQQKLYQACENLISKLKNWKGFFFEALDIQIAIAREKNDVELIISTTRELSRHYRYIEEKNIYLCIDSFMSIGCDDEALSLLKKAESFLEKSSWLEYIKARFTFDNKDYLQVIILLNDNLIKTLPSWAPPTEAYKLRASAYEKMNLFSKAFADYSSMAAITKQQVKEKKVRNDVIKYKNLNLKALPKSKNFTPKFRLAFMAGFPRSGTTLLSTILSTLDNVEILKEVGAIEHVKAIFESKLDKYYPQDLPKLTSEEISLLRDEYYNFVQSLPQAERINADTLVIDNMPFHTVDIPLILTLFPAAKIIFPLRHPLDVCLSCFQQNFSQNHGTHYLIELKDCANRYNQVFNLFESYRNHLTPDMHYIRYEDLVENITAEMSKLSGFLDIPTNNNYAEFYKHAKNQFISTASRDQVKQPLYTSSAYKWKNYQEHLTAIMPIVKAHIENFGYTE